VRTTGVAAHANQDIGKRMVGGNQDAWTSAAPEGTTYEGAGGQARVHASRRSRPVGVPRSGGAYGTLERIEAANGKVGSPAALISTLARRTPPSERPRE
jgi:hypothetical protein